MPRLIHTSKKRDNKGDTKDNIAINRHRMKLLLEKHKKQMNEVDHRMKETEETAANSTKKRRIQLSSNERREAEASSAEALSTEASSAEALSTEASSVEALSTEASS